MEALKMFWQFFFVEYNEDEGVYRKASREYTLLDTLFVLDFSTV